MRCHVIPTVRMLKSAKDPNRGHGFVTAALAAPQAVGIRIAAARGRRMALELE